MNVQKVTKTKTERAPNGHYAKSYSQLENVKSCHLSVPRESEVTFRFPSALNILRAVT